MAIVLPHVFQDGVGETASGVQVNEDLTVLKNAIEAQEAAVASLQTQRSGAKVSGALAPPENAHRAIPESSIVTPGLVGGQVLIVSFSALLLPAGGNTVFASLVVNGVETGWVLRANFETATSVVERLSGKAGAITLSGNAWASAAVGSAQCAITYQILNG